MKRTSIYNYFSQLPDPHIHRNKRHNLTDIIVLSVLAVLCGAESYDSNLEFGKARIDFLKQVLKLPNGIPSHDVINRVISLIKPD
ncbi:MAG: transposase family protein, partial [Bacteroidales bacterium]